MSGNTNETIDYVRRQRQRFVGICLGSVIAAVVFAALASPFGPAVSTGIRTFLSVLSLLFALAFIVSGIAYSKQSQHLLAYTIAEENIAKIVASESSTEIVGLLGSLGSDPAKHFPAAQKLVKLSYPKLQTHLEAVRRREHALKDAAARLMRTDRLKARFDKTLLACVHEIERRRKESPALKANRVIQEVLAQANARKVHLEAQWEQADAKLSWWGKLNHEPLDTKDLDKKIENLELAQRRLEKSGDLVKTNQFFDNLKERSLIRIRGSAQAASGAIPQSHETPFDEDRIAKNALILAGMSVPVSAWNDISQAGNVYDALREVHGTYAGMSDFSIWLDTLMLPHASLVGLTSLAKGSYFEKLVEADIGGMRFEHFNHPDTDIVIDGIAYQIKATDSESYINSVADNIPVISTSEVAEAVGAIDGGYANADLSESVDLALGGSVLDFSDTALDAVLTGVGGLGLLSILKGIGKGKSSYREGSDLEDAIVDGVGTAVVSTAKASVDTAELAYKAIMSRPSRFAGRMVLKGLNGAVNAIDRKLEEK